MSASAGLSASKGMTMTTSETPPRVKSLTMRRLEGDATRASLQLIAIAFVAYPVIALSLLWEMLIARPWRAGIIHAENGHKRRKKAILELEQYRKRADPDAFG